MMSGNLVAQLLHARPQAVALLWIVSRPAEVSWELTGRRTGVWSILTLPFNMHSVKYYSSSLSTPVLCANR